MASDIQTNLSGATAPHSDAPLGDVILKTEGLTKHYGGVHALEDANFEIRRGEHVAIMGDNGAGKSTFVRQITGVEQRTRGEIIFNGQPVNFAGPLDAREGEIQAFTPACDALFTPDIDGALDEETAKRCTDAGASLVLCKSNGTERLVERIEALIDEYKSKMPSASLDQDMGRCIVKATADVFRTMMNLKISAGEPVVEKAKIRSAEVIGSIGVAGFLSGSISLFMPKSIAKKAVAAMLMMEPDELADGDLVDAIGELTNMVGGGIKTELFQKAPLFDISVPSVYVGEDLQRRTVSQDLCFLVPFTVGEETFSVEFLMVTKKDGGTGVQASVVDSMQKV